MIKNKFILVLPMILMFAFCMIALSACTSNDEKILEVNSESGSLDYLNVFDSNVDLDAYSSELIYVYVCGAVKNPGVASLPVGSRAEIALEWAGGFTEDADEIYVNLAAVLSDGQRLYFPYKGDDIELQFEEEDAKSLVASNSLVNINTADVSELCTIPGVGESKAKAIIEFRTENGSFSDISDIMLVSGIGESSFDKIKDYICVK